MIAILFRWDLANEVTQRDWQVPVILSCHNA